MYNLAAASVGLAVFKVDSIGYQGDQPLVLSERR